MESDDDEESEDDASTETGKDDSESKIATPDGTTKKKTKTPRPKKPKDATKKPVRKERAKTNRKIKLDFQNHRKRAEILEDPDLDKEIDALASGALKNQVQTLQFSRLMGKTQKNHFYTTKNEKVKSILIDLFFSILKFELNYKKPSCDCCGCCARVNYHAVDFSLITMV